MRRLYEDFPELANAKVQFWICLNPEHHGVTWKGDVAHCDKCGLTSEMTQDFAMGVANGGQLIVTYDGDDDYAPTPEEFKREVQRAIDSDSRCSPATVDIPGGS